MSSDPTVCVAPRTERLLPIVDAEAPAERLAMLRVLTGGFAVAYLAIRLPVFLELADRTSGFDPVGLAALLSGPLPSGVVTATILVTLVAGVAFTLGWRFRITGPAFALGMLCLSTYRSSWGQLLHFEHLIVLHLLIVALAPAADAWSMDACRRTASAHERIERPPTSYGWPIALAALVVVITYVIAGLAKLRYGGLEWIVGDTLRNHVAYSAARLDLLGGRIRTAWVIAAWLMHAGILAFMLVGFPYPLFLVAFAPFFRIERLWWDRPTWVRRPVVSRPSTS